jgi:hypothetical protein
MFTFAKSSGFSLPVILIAFHFVFHSGHENTPSGVVPFYFELHVGNPQLTIP